MLDGQNIIGDTAPGAAVMAPLDDEPPKGESLNCRDRQEHVTI